MGERPAARARNCRFVVWLHGLGDCGRANEFIADFFSAAAFADARWAFPTVPVTCNRGMFMRLWFDIHDTPITSKSVRDEEDVLKAVQMETMTVTESRWNKPGRRVRFGLKPRRCVEHRERVALPEKVGRLCSLQWFPSLQFLFCYQSYS